MARHIPDRQLPAMTWEDTLATMRTLDRWRAAVGLVFAADEVQG